jgi:hypothetical protein
MVKGDKAIAAILRKTQLRLIDSNNQSQDLASDLDSILKRLENKSVDLKLCLTVQGIRLFILSDSFFRIYKYLKRKKNFST